MGKMWQALDEKAKGPYEKKAEAAKKKYAEEMAAYEAWALDILYAFLWKALYLHFNNFTLTEDYNTWILTVSLWVKLD